MKVWIAPKWTKGTKEDFYRTFISTPPNCPKTVKIHCLEGKMVNFLVPRNRKIKTSRHSLRKGPGVLSAARVIFSRNPKNPNFNAFPFLTFPYLSLPYLSLSYFCTFGLPLPYFFFPSLTLPYQIWRRSRTYSISRKKITLVVNFQSRIEIFVVVPLLFAQSGFCKSIKNTVAILFKF